MSSLHSDKSASVAEDVERALLDAIVGRDRQAMKRLYMLYHGRLFKFIYRFSATYEQTEELVNDVMMVVWKNAGTFRGASRVSTWIFGIAYRLTMKRVSKRRLEVVAGDLTETLVCDRANDTEKQDWVLQSLAMLPDVQRITVLLTFYAGFSYEEIAEITDCPVNTVKTRMFHARRRLKEILNQQGSPATDSEKCHV